MTTYPISQSPHCRWGAGQFCSIIETAPKSLLLCVNRSPIHYDYFACWHKSYPEKFEKSFKLDSQDLFVLTRQFFICFQDKAQEVQNSRCSFSSENRSVSPIVQSFNPPTPPSSAKKPAASTVIVLDWKRFNQRNYNLNLSLSLVYKCICCGSILSLV